MADYTRPSAPAIRQGSLIAGGQVVDPLVPPPQVRSTNKPSQAGNNRATGGLSTRPNGGTTAAQPSQSIRQTQQPNAAPAGSVRYSAPAPPPPPPPLPPPPGGIQPGLTAPHQSLRGSLQPQGSVQAANGQTRRSSILQSAAGIAPSTLAVPRSLANGSVPTRQSFTMGLDSSLTPASVSVYRNSIKALLDTKYRRQDDQDGAFLEGARRIVEFMYNMWTEQKMCDLLVQTHDGDVQAHQIALAAYSDSLAAKFAQRSLGEAVTINLTDFRRDVVMDVLNFIYTTDLELSCQNIGQVLACARELDILVILEICTAYLSETADVDNLVLHYSIAENNGLTDLRDQLQQQICARFAEVSNTKHFVYIPFDRLICLVADSRLVINNELDLFIAVVRWIDFDRVERMQYATRLFTYVRFRLIQPEALATQVEVVEWIFIDNERREFLFDAYRYHALVLSGSSLASALNNPQRVQPQA